MADENFAAAVGTRPNGKFGHLPTIQTLTDRSRLQVHLRSRIGDRKRLSPYVPSLPPNKTVVNVLEDYLCYLKKCIRKYIEDTQINGAGLWTALESSEGIHYVLAHPNGLEGSEQSWMRKAAVQAGFTERPRVYSICD